VLVELVTTREVPSRITLGVFVPNPFPSIVICVPAEFSVTFKMAGRGGLDCAETNVADARDTRRYSAKRRAHFMTNLQHAMG
jgi:hypothetical protein